MKAALTDGGVEADGETLTTPFTVDYPRSVPITFPDAIPDPVVDINDYGNNVFTGTSAGETINGTDGNDYFHNLGGGSDTVNGGEGNDLFLSDGAYDVFNGGGGSDTVSYANATSWVDAQLSSGNYGSGFGNISGVGLEPGKRDHYRSIENLIGSDFGDRLRGGDGDNQIEGGAGNDNITGGNGGTNTLYGGAGSDKLIAATNSGSHNTLIGGADNDTFVIAQQDNIIDIIRDFTPDDGDKIHFLIGDSASKNSLDALLNDNYLNHQSTTTDTDYTGNGQNDTVLTFNISIFTSGDYILILEGYTAPLLIDYISVEVDA